jgi:tetratricopeptide (TPR) repeat protein
MAHTPLSPSVLRYYWRAVVWISRRPFLLGARPWVAIAIGLVVAAAVAFLVGLETPYVSIVAGALALIPVAGLYSWNQLRPREGGRVVLIARFASEGVQASEAAISQQDALLQRLKQSQLLTKYARFVRLDVTISPDQAERLVRRTPEISVVTGHVRVGGSEAAWDATVVGTYVTGRFEIAVGSAQVVLRSLDLPASTVLADPMPTEGSVPLESLARARLEAHHADDVEAALSYQMAIAALEHQAFPDARSLADVGDALSKGRLTGRVHAYAILTRIIVDSTEGTLSPRDAIARIERSPIEPAYAGLWSLAEIYASVLPPTREHLRLRAHLAFNALQCAPTDPDRMLQLASANQARGRHDEALSAVKPLLSAPEPVRSVALVMRAASLTSLREYSQATAALDQVREGTRTAGVLTLRGFVAYGRRDFETALKHFRKALAKDPQDQAALHGHHASYHELHDHCYSEWIYDRIDRLPLKVFGRHRRRLGFLLGTAFQGLPYHRRIRGYLGLLALVEGRYVDAAQSLLAQIQYAPEWPSAYAYLALVLAVQGQPVLSREMLLRYRWVSQEATLVSGSHGPPDLSATRRQVAMFPFEIEPDLYDASLGTFLTDVSTILAD